MSGADAQGARRLMDQPWSIPGKVGRTSDPGRFLGRDEPIFMRVDTACLFFFSMEIHCFLSHLKFT